MFDQIYKATNQWYGRISAGYLELQYAGLYGEVATSLMNGRISLRRGSAVRKRTDNVLAEDDYTLTYKTAF